MLEVLHSLLEMLSGFYRSLPAQLWFSLYLAFTLGAVIFITLQRRPPTTTLAWTIAFVSLPFIGAAVYFFFGPRKLRRRRMRRRLAKKLAEGFAPSTQAQMPEKLADRTWLTSLARVASSSGDALPRASQELKLFSSGDETYQAIEAGIKAAKHQVHMEYYIFDPDASGTMLRDAMVERAKAGVAVRVLIDAMGSKAADAKFWKPLSDAGGEVRLFNPAKLLKLGPGKLNFRTHRKIVVIDGLHAFTGGINVSAGNSALSSGGAAWRDTHLELRGAPALDLQVVFLEDWLYAGVGNRFHPREDQSIDEVQRDLKDWFPDAPLGNGPWVQIVDSGPDERTHDIHRYFFTAITSARRRIWITTPYFVPDEPIIMALVTAAARGVDVKIILPKQGDSKLVTAAASTFADEVDAQGVDVHEYQPRMIHAKTMVVDDELAVIGTANMDNRSFRLNFEVVAAIYDKGIAAQLAQLFTQDLAESKPVTTRTRSRKVLPRLMASIARLFAPLL